MTELATPLIAGAVAALGWYATYAYARRREDRTRRIEIRLKYHQRQIEELYGPLSSLIQQIFIAWEVREDLLRAPGKAYSDDEIESIRELFWQRYFSPLHTEIAAILRTRLYLVEDGIIPDSFEDYLKHATQEAAQHRLWSELNIETEHVPGKPFPGRFDRDVREARDRLLEKVTTGLAAIDAAPR